jgi:hypothetical protein
LIDLGSVAGRKLFATAINGVLDHANFSAIQYDGFEKLQLIAAFDFVRCQVDLHVHVPLFSIYRSKIGD